MGSTHFIDDFAFNHKPSFSLLPYYDKLAEELAKNNMYAEMNSGCYQRCSCEIGMDANMIKAVKVHGVKILTASDAHRPEDVGSDIIMMEKMLEKSQ